MMREQTTESLAGAGSGLYALPLLQGKMRSVSKLPSKVGSLAVCSHPSVPSNYNGKSNNSFKCQNNICFVNLVTEMDTDECYPLTFDKINIIFGVWENKWY